MIEIHVRVAARLVAAAPLLALAAACAVPLPRPRDGHVDGSEQTGAAPRTTPDRGDAPKRSLLTQHYSIDRRDEVLKFKPHDTTYFGGSWTSDTNEASNTSPTEELKHGELEFQFSLKTRLPLPRGGWLPDTWVAYTQQSQWQVGQPSGPFRETNYEPEGFFLWPVGDWGKWGDVRLRLAGFGINHQSNGRGGTESRSWNRIIGQLAFEFGESTTLLFRPWWRMPESSKNDDNPDIDDYLGDGDLSLSHQFPCFGYDLTAAALLRNNLDFNTNRGAVELSLSGPFFHESIAWYLQGFTGYGKTLIDYDHRQQVLVVGIALRGWDSDPKPGR